MHDLIHDKRRARHVAGVLHERDEEIEDEDLRKERRHTAHTSDDTVDEHCFHRSVGEGPADKVAEPSEEHVEPVLGISTEPEGSHEHDGKNQDKDREADETVGKDPVKHMGYLISILLVAFLVFSFFQGTVDESVFGIHDGGLGVDLRLFHHTLGSLVAMFEDLIGIGQLTDIFLYFLVPFQEFDGKVTGGEALAKIGFFLQVF